MTLKGYRKVLIQGEVLKRLFQIQDQGKTVVGTTTTYPSLSEVIDSLLDKNEH